MSLIAKLRDLWWALRALSAIKSLIESGDKEKTMTTQLPPATPTPKPAASPAAVKGPVRKLGPWKTTDHGLMSIEGREGCDLHASLSGIHGDPWTIGYGHTHFDGAPFPAMGMMITEAEAKVLLRHDIVRYEEIVHKAIHVPLADHEADALVSICYNVEEALSPHSSIVKALNRGDYTAAAAAIMLYDKPPEIAGRRRGEQVQFRTPYKE
jgi:lysozyme